MQKSMCMRILINSELNDADNNYYKMSPYLMRLYS